MPKSPFFMRLIISYDKNNRTVGMFTFASEKSQNEKDLYEINNWIKSITWDLFINIISDYGIIECQFLCWRLLHEKTHISAISMGGIFRTYCPGFLRFG